MGVVADRLASSGYDLPPVPSALGSYVPAVAVGGLVFTSGQLPFEEGSLLAAGLVGVDVSLEEAVACARRAALNALAAASTVCDLDGVERCVRLTGYVASGAGFDRQPAVVDGASEVLVAAFGDGGRHSRCAIGVAALPLSAPVELDLVLSLRA